jgi:hypothetical protein
MRAMSDARERDGAAGERKTDTVGRTASWQQAHEALLRLAKARAGLDFDEGARLLEALRARAHERLGFGSFVEYIERLFGYAPRLTHDKLRVAEALEELPELGKALREGQVSWSCVRGASLVIGGAVCPRIQLPPRQSSTCSGSRFRARFSPLFARPWPTEHPRASVHHLAEETVTSASKGEHESATPPGERRNGVTFTRRRDGRCTSATAQGQRGSSRQIRNRRTQTGAPARLCPATPRKFLRFELRLGSPSFEASSTGLARSSRASLFRRRNRATHRGSLAGFRDHLRRRGT